MTAATCLALSVAPTTSVAGADTAPPAGSNLPSTVSADALPTVQENGVVWAQVLVGDTVYATGDFSETWPAGQTESTGNETARSNLLAYDITTGELTSFSHTLNAQGRGIAVSPDGSTVYVVGNFTSVDGQTRDHIAAFDTADGTLVPTFHPSLNAVADAVVATNSTVYVGGGFTASGGHTRDRLAAFDAGTGGLLAWAPPASGPVEALAAAQDGSRIYVGGTFKQLDGADVYGLDALDPTSGDSLGFAINHVIEDATGGGNCGVTSLSVAANVVYGTTFASGCGDFEGRFAADATTGDPIWINDCHGDSYDAVPIGQILYSVGHAHDCSAVGAFPDNSEPYKYQRTLAETTFATGTDTGPDAYGWNYAGRPDATILHWFPTLTPGTVTGQTQAAWSIVGNADYIALGGEFPSVNGVAQAGLVRFAVRADAPNQVGPVPSSTLTPTASSTGTGVVNLSWKATWDKDNADLSYAVVRDGTTIATVHQSSTFWQLPTITYTDTGLTPGSTHTYRIVVTDPLANSTQSAKSDQVTVAGTGTPPTAGPQASFSTSCSQSTCALDASGSTDSGSTISSYTWDFGDGKQSTGATVSHTYATSGPHTITLTVQDGAGAVASVSQGITTTPAPQKVLAMDTFRRTDTSGWGDADVGGVWIPATACGKLSVRRDTGYFVAHRSRGCSISLRGVHTGSTDSTTALTTTTRPKGGIELAVLGRRLSATQDIRLQLHVLPGGDVTAQLVARNGATVRALSQLVTLSVGYAAQTKLMVRLQVSGTKPTVVRAKVWTGTTEPSAWTVSGHTYLSALQHDGTVGYAAYLPKARNAASVTVRTSNLKTTLVAH